MANEPDKTTPSVEAKYAIALAFDLMGGVAGLVKWAKSSLTNKSIFYSQLYAKVIPLQVAATAKIEVESSESGFEVLSRIINGHIRVREEDEAAGIFKDGEGKVITDPETLALKKQIWALEQKVAGVTIDATANEPAAPSEPWPITRTAPPVPPPQLTVVDNKERDRIEPAKPAPPSSQPPPPAPPQELSNDAKWRQWDSAGGSSNERITWWGPV